MYERRYYQKWTLELSIPLPTLRNCSSKITELIEDLETSLQRIDPRIKVRRYLQ